MSGDPAKRHFAEFNEHIIKRHALTGMECRYTRTDLYEAERALNRELVEVLKAMRDRYVRLADSGDCGFWEPREQGVVQDATAAIAKAEARHGSDEGDPD